MTTAMLPETSTSTAQSSRERTVDQIIDTARSRPAEGRGAWIVSGVTAILLWASFTPLDWGPLAWIALVPLLLLVRLQRPTRRMYLAVWCGGFVSILASLQWMRLGHATMYPAWVALSVYMAVYFPLFVGLSRVAVHRLRIPLWLAAPVVWVGLELTRARLMTGFAWYFLSHTQYRWLEVIQISDVTGAYGVSFLVAMANGCLAGLVSERVFRKLRLLPDGGEQGAAESPVTAKRRWIGVAGTLTVFALVLGYGFVRRGQAEFREGPRVALVQANFVTEVKHDPDPATMSRILHVHRELTRRAIQERPDIIVWPETMLPVPVLATIPDLDDEELVALIPPEMRHSVTPAEWMDRWRESHGKKMLEVDSFATNAATIIGASAHVAGHERIRRYNSAFFVRPDLGVSKRYDKMHRVVFGEYIPLRDTLPFLQQLTPYGGDSGIAAGARPAVFEYAGARMTPLICFEDTVPHLVRRIVDVTRDDDGRPVDLLVNLTNDGWFHGSSELDQHLITAAFRAVECRTPMVRAVNTGISAVIDGDGAIVEPDVFVGGNLSEPLQDRENEAAGSKPRDGKLRPLSYVDPETGRWRKSLDAVVVDSVPLDSRESLYVRWGDWFAGVCAAAVVSLLVVGALPRKLFAKDAPAA